MTRSLELFNQKPAPNGNFAGRNLMVFGFRLECDDAEDRWPIPPNIDWSTINVSLKKAGGTYELLVENGSAPAKYLPYVYCDSDPIGTGERGTGCECTCDRLSRGIFIWRPHQTLPDGGTYWMKIVLYDEEGNYYEEEWWFTTASWQYIGPAVLSYAGPQNFGIVAHDTEVVASGVVTWSKDNSCSPHLYEMWLEPVYLPDDVVVEAALDGNTYALTDDTWHKLIGLCVAAQETLSLQVSIISNKTVPQWERISLRLHAIGYAGTGVNGTGIESTGGMAEYDVLTLDFIGYCLNDQATTYFEAVGLLIE